MLKKLLILLLVVLSLFSFTSCASIRAAEEEAVARAEANDEAVAREWILDLLTEETKTSWGSAGIESASARNWVDQCVLRAAEAVSLRASDADFWRVTKVNSLEPSYESKLTSVQEEALEKFMMDCSVEMKAPQELIRSGILRDAYYS